MFKNAKTVPASDGKATARCLLPHNLLYRYAATMAEDISVAVISLQSSKNPLPPWESV